MVKTVAILVDIRPESQRATEGSIEGALVVERNVLAAIALQDLGLCRATDVVGGFQAWTASGLPTVPTSKAS